jgi:hypothetical protein
MNAKGDHKGNFLYSDIDEVMMMIMVDQRCVRWYGEDAIQNWKLFDSVQSTLSEYAQFSIELILNCPLKKTWKDNILI